MKLISFFEMFYRCIIVYLSELNTWNFDLKLLFKDSILTDVSQTQPEQTCLYITVLDWRLDLSSISVFGFFLRMCP